MAITVVCPNPACRSESVISDSYTGRRIRCKKCATGFIAAPTVEQHHAETATTSQPNRLADAEPSPTSKVPQSRDSQRSIKPEIAKPSVGDSAPAETSSNPPVSSKFDQPIRLKSEPDDDLSRRSDVRSASARDVTPAGKFASFPASFGRYQVSALLGQGGMGSVYLAEDVQLGRQVALKLPSFEPGASPQRIERFLREARSAAQLQHPNICTLYDAGEINGQPFIAMAVIQGVRLDEMIRPDEPMRAPRAVQIVRKIALALAHAHSRGIVHRDLKPANVMLTPDGEPIVMDFGLAKRISDGDDNETRLTREGAVLGTPAYMAPEQVRGEVNSIGPATDIYSLGVLFFELLSGQTPFQGPIGVVMAQILTAPTPRLSDLQLGVDPIWSELCRNAMQRDPSRRIASMAEFASRLDLSPEGTDSSLVQPAAGDSHTAQKSRSVSVKSARSQPALRVATTPPDVVDLDALIPEEEDQDTSPDGVDVTATTTRRGHRRRGKTTKQAFWKRTWFLPSGVVALLLTLASLIWLLSGRDGELRIDLADQVPQLALLIDGQPTDWNGNETILQLGPGSHEITIDAPQFERLIRRVTIDPGQRQTLAVTLTPRTDVANAKSTDLHSLGNADSPSQTLSESPPQETSVPTEAVPSKEPPPDTSQPTVADSPKGKSTKSTSAVRVIASPAKQPPAGAPALLTSPFTPQEIASRQKEWVQYLDRKNSVEQNSIGMTMILIPPGEFTVGGAEKSEAAVREAIADGYVDAKQEHFEAALPQVKVVITEPFLISRSEVTLGEFNRFIKETNYITDSEKSDRGGRGYTAPQSTMSEIKGKKKKNFVSGGSSFSFKSGGFSYGKQFSWSSPGWTPYSNNHPVVNVSWNDATAFIDWLNTKDGGGYRLLTEVEWEYCARGGNTHRFGMKGDSKSLEKIGNVRDASFAKLGTNEVTIRGSDSYSFAAAVGKFEPNQFGLYDMVGNVSEWCSDVYNSSTYVFYKKLGDPIYNPGGITGVPKNQYRVFRGGSWGSQPYQCRVDFRNGLQKFECLDTLGFRVARSLKTPPTNNP